MVKLSEYALLESSSLRTKFAQVIDEFNQTATPYPRYQTIHSLFREQVAANPAQVAVEWVDDTEQIHHYTYAELDQQSDAIARFLRGRGVQEEDIVAFWIDSPAYLISTVLGILKAGAAYVSLSTTFPFERNKYIVEDTATRVIISEKKYVKDLQKLQWECSRVSTVLCVDSDDIHTEPETANELMKKELWDYVGEEAHDDIEGGGWVNSYTGENLSRQVMDEYGDNIVHKLKPLLRKTDKVLEIGCSSGISMFRLAPLVESYYGTDLSDEILKKTESERARLGLENIHLQTLPAHKVDEVGERDFDLIIINSVIQCFNGYNYLRQVLGKALSLLKEEGKLFLGDLMDQDQKQALVDSLIAFKKEHLGQGYTTKTDWSNELFLSRRYLEDLQHDFPEIVFVEHSEKIGTEQSELSEFRFDSLLTIRKNAPQPPDLQPRHKYQFDKKALSFEEKEPFPLNGNARNLAYVSYTSGTTGKPKGVLIEHRSVVRLVRNTNYIDIQPTDRLTQLAPLSFDASTFEIWGALLNGATVVSVTREDLLRPDVFERRMKTHRVTTSWLTSSLFNRLLDERPSAFSELKTLLTGGDVLSPLHINRVREENPSLQVINGYGPTENTTFSACFAIEQAYDKSIPIGRPIANSQCYVLKPNLEPVAVGMNGELYVSGDGLARGYLNDPVLTAEKFLPHPFLDGERLYRTGDLAKWLPDGTLRFLGRNDEQVKIRGYRVEVAEIEAAIQQISGLKQVVVQVRKFADDEKYLCAYLVVPQGVTLDSIKKALAGHLPGYMLPAYWVELDAFPLNTNGKVDKRQLPDPQTLIAESGMDFIAPRTPLEKDLTEVWKSVLGLPHIGMQENFFSIGGHSLKATQLVSRVQRDLGLDLTIREVFTYSTLLEMSRYLTKKRRIQLHPILPVPDQDYYILSHAQKRLWIIDQFEEERIAYSMPTTLLLEGIDRVALERAFQELVARHESLRTIFVDVNGEPMQKIYSNDDYQFRMGYRDLRAEARPLETAKQLAHQDIQTPFDLSVGPLFRATLLEIQTGTYVLVLNMHHIISDGWSMKVMKKELMELYSASPVPAGGLQYRDYAAWQQLQLTGENQDQHRTYWLEQLSGELPVLDLPTDFPRPAIKTTHGAVLVRSLDKPLVRALTELGQKHGASLFFTLVAAIKTLFYRYTGQPDVLIGTLVAGRDHPDLESQIGLFVNLLVVRTRLSAQESFANVLDQVTATMLDAFEHQVYPFEQLVEELHLRPDLSRSPLSDVVVTFQNTGMENALEVLPEGMKIEPLNIAPASHETDLSIKQSPPSKVDLTLTFEETPHGVQVEAQYNTDLFTENRISRLLTHFTNLLQAVVKAPETEIGTVEYLSDEEKNQLDTDFRSGPQTSIPTLTLHEWIDQQAAIYSDKTALVCGDTSYTYAQIQAQSSQLAQCLVQHWHIQPGDLVGLSMNRSAEVVVAMLAILKAGAAYVPLDPDYPTHRLAYIATDSQAKIVICDTDEPADWPDWNGSCVAFSTLVSQAARYPETTPDVASQPSDLAYVLYTSGSTGNPKGVMIAHTSVVNFMQSMQHQPGLTDTDVLLAVTPYSFDISVLELFLPLVSGATGVIATQAVVREPSLLIEYMTQVQPTIMQATPSLWKTLLESGWEGSPTLTVLCGGEALPESLARPLMAVCANLWNMYGPTETTIWSVIQSVQTEEDLFSIGKPIQNTEIYILDEHLQPVPVGIEGELYIGGPGLAKGYWNKPELTAEKFIQNPFQAGGRLYRTGDVACWLENGTIRFVGRKDNQVKLHGYRIELGDIESHLRRHPDIEDVAVYLHDYEGNKELVACLVVRNPLEASDVRSYLSACVPAYMVPHHVLFLEALPQTANGKLDRKRLPAPQRTVHTDTYEAPATPTEESLVRIWERILGIEQVGATDNFFDLGGHSLKATQMVSRIHRELGVKLLLKDIFAGNTLRELARLVDASSQTAYETIRLLEPQPYYELSHAQKRLWILHKLQENQTAYNMPLVHLYTGDFHRPAFEKTIQTLVERHESFRTTFVETDGHPYQKIHAVHEWHVPVQYTDVRQATDPDATARQLAETDTHLSFDLERGPLLRVHLIQIADDRMLLSFHMHHIISDGWSMGILIREALTLYESYVQRQPVSLPMLRVQYKDFAAWQGRQSVLQQEEAYWMKKLSGTQELLTLPYDFPATDTYAFRGDRLSLDLDETLTQQLREIALHNQTSLSNVVFTIFNILLYHMTGRQEITVGIAVANRTHADLENIIGFFVNSLVIRNTIPEEVEFDQLLRQVSETLVEAFDHQNYPFDLLVERLSPDRQSRQPLFNVFYSFTAAARMDASEAAEESVPGQQKGWGEAGEATFLTAKFDLTLFAFEMEHTLRLTFEYNSDRFAARSIEKYLHFFEKITQAVLPELSRGE